MKKGTKNNIACFISGAIITSTIGAIAASYTATTNEFPIKLNGQDIQLEGYNINGNTYFKLRDIGNKMGFDVEFNNDTIYIGDISANSSDISYYSNPYSWCPDFGEYTSTTLLENGIQEGEFTKSYIYYAEKSDFQKYVSLLTDMGFKKGFVDGDMTRLAYVKDDCVIELALSDPFAFAKGTVTIILVQGQWAADKIKLELDR